MQTTQFTFEAIGQVESCFSTNFGIPRQPGLVPEARGRIRLFAPGASPESVRGLEAFSHLWVVFVFHRLKGATDKATVRPPRLGGNTRLGVFASRATHRPNPIGLSLVKLEAIDCSGTEVVLEVSGLDMVEGTPVLDIKPYLPYAEALPHAEAGYASEAPQLTCAVVFSPQARQQAQALEAHYAQFTALLTRVLALDPRPAFHQQGSPRQGRVYGLELYDQNIRWQVDSEQRITVLDILPTAERDND
ncbi:MAG: tRNA (N6-threonylcarbamoyladenosine(37)-N6)-methyltransferase TrmO [Gammaproteobacteria bacterium]